WRDPTIFKWRQTEPAIILCAVRWYLRYLLSLRDVEELWRSAAWPPITPRFGVGCSVTAPNSSNGSGVTSSPPISPRGLVKPPFGSRTTGVICIGPSTRRARPLISYYRLGATHMPPNGCFARP